MSDSEKTYTIRIEGTAGHYGLGEEIAKDCYLFKAGHYGLTVEELQALISVTAKGKSHGN